MHVSTKLKRLGRTCVFAALAICCGIGTPFAALNRTSVGVYQSGNNFGDGTYATSSFTPPANSLVTVIVSAISTNGSSAVGANLSLTQSLGATVTSRLQGSDDGSWTLASRVFSYEVGASPASQTVTADCGTTNIYHYKVEVYAYTGYNAGSPFGATATGTGTYDGAKTIVLSSAPASSSDVLAFAARGSVTTGATASSPWVELSDTTLENDWLSVQSMARTGSTSTSVTWDDVNTTGSGMYSASYAAIEIQEAASGSGLLRRRRGN